MKKALLSVAAIATTVLTGWANEYTFVFDGNNDMGGLIRQTSNKEADLIFSDSFAISDEGIDLTVKKTDGSAPGLALINAGGTNAGLCLFSSFFKSMTPEISLTVPGGKITAVKLYMSGGGLISLDVPFNGEAVEPEIESPLYSWTWRDPDGVETIKCSWLSNTETYIHSIEVRYTPDLGGKRACGLSFPIKEYEAFLGEGFTSPTVNNPNKLNVSWSSSDEAVATVDSQGKVTLVGRGSTFIKAATEGNDEFAAGNARYSITVIPTADNISGLLQVAPAVYDRVKVNFPVTVNFANTSFAFVTDAEGNATCIDNTINRNSTSTSATTIYQVGDVIPAGWVATNATIYESVIWEGQPGKVTETVSVTYPKVSAVTPADADRVVILKNVTFTGRTAEGYEKAYGTTPDGTRYEFQDTYGTSAKGAGTYDVTCVVRYSKRGSTEYFYLAPIAYGEPSGSDQQPEDPADPTYPEKLSYTINGGDALEGVSVSQEITQGSLSINVTGETDADEVVLSFATPEEWDGLMIMAAFADVSEIEFAKTRSEEDWYPIDYADMMGFVKGNTVTFPVDGEENWATVALYKGDRLYATTIEVNFDVKKKENDPGQQLTFPDWFVLTLGNDGLEEWQGEEKGVYTIKVTGEIEEDEAYVTIDVPEGWTGLLSDAEDVSEFGSVGPKKAAAFEWLPLETAIERGWKKGNRFVFPANGKQQDVAIRLYKDDMYDAAPDNWIALEVNVSKKQNEEPAPEFPESFDVTVSFEGAEVTQGEEWGVYTVNVSGTAPEDTYTVTVAVPEGWDGFIGMTDIEYGSEAEPLKKAQAAEWMPLDYLLENGFKQSNTLTFPADGEEHLGTLYLYKGEQVDIANGIQIDTEVSKQVVEEEPVYPEQLDYTINGAAELEGVTVAQEMIQGSLSINITGETDAEEVALSFATPEGWDGLMIMAAFADVSEIEFAKTRSEEDWYPIEYADMMGFVKGNTVTFPVDGEENWATVALYKGDRLYATSIEVNFDVKKKENDPDQQLTFPDWFVLTLGNDGLVEQQGEEYGVYTIKVTGEIEEDEAYVTIDVPEGWTGFISDAENVSEGGSVGPRKVAAFEWQPLETALENGWKMGNRFVFSANGTQQDVAIRLYKDDMYDAAPDNWIALEVNVSKKQNEEPAPEFPASFDVTVSFEGAEVTQGEDWGVYTVNVTGTAPEDTYTVTVAIPEGWDGFLGMTDADYESEAEPLKKVQATEWMSLEYMLENGFKAGNELTFPADGEEHKGVLYLYKGDQVDVANSIQIEVEVRREGTAVNVIEAAEDAEYYNINGLRIAKPNGIYIKVVDGKAVKSVS